MKKKKIKKYRNRIEWFNKNKNAILSIFLMTLIAMICGNWLDSERNRPEEVTYKQYISDLEAGMDVLDENGKVIKEVDDKIDTVYYNTDGSNWRYTLWTEDSREKYNQWIKDGKSPTEFEYKYDKKDWREFEMPSYENDTIQDHFSRYDIYACRTIKEKSFEPIFVLMLPLVGSVVVTFAMMFAFLAFYAKKMSNLGSIGKNLLVNDTGVRFKDVIGHDEVIEDLQLIVNLMRKARESAEDKTSSGFKFNANIPRGMLFLGEAGTGKTLLAKAVAGEAGVPFLYMNASGFVEMYVGVGARRVRELFKLARQNSPCIVFIDEIDAVGTDRSVSTTSEQKQTINALLQEMDGFDTKSGIFVIAATNFADTLDKALVRSGRFDRQVIINPPQDYSVRVQLFEQYLKEDKHTADLEAVSRQCVGFTGADISAICNEARLIAISKDVDAITTEILEEAVDRKVFKGNHVENKKGTITEELKIVSYHEAGHALMSLLLGVPIARATIVGTTGGTGGAVFKADESKKFVTKKDFENQIMIAYGGRAAEEIIFGKEYITTGASNDILQATDILKKYIGSYGFDGNLVTLSALYEEKLYSEYVVQRVQELSATLYADTLEMLKVNRLRLEHIAEALRTKETINGEELKNIN